MMLMEIRNLKKYFFSKRGVVKAVDGVSLSIGSPEIVGLVGESGCGKSTIGKIAAGLYAPYEGEVQLAGKSFQQSTGPEKKEYRKKVQYLFQDAASAFNPKMRIQNILLEPLQIHKLFFSPKERMKRVDALLELVGLKASDKMRFPHEFSGGQRQRINIARALALEPTLLICDEPIAALDVSIQSQIINLLKELQISKKLSYLFISHDLTTVKYLCDRVAVMYLGKIVEMAPTEHLYTNPRHPYTRKLLSSIPSQNMHAFSPIEGDMPSPFANIQGCAFASRCPNVYLRCRQSKPTYKQDDKHAVACHLEK